MPEQLTRLTIFTLLILLGYFVVKPALTPDTYGDLGRYRGAALQEIADRSPLYQGEEECAVCHGGVAETWAQSLHGTVSCETCHGAGVTHVSSPVEHDMAVPEEANIRQFCGLCHHERVGRPAAFPQVDLEEHMTDMPCTLCHNPHEVAEP